MRVNVLLTDGFQRKTLAALRGLSQEGLRVAVGEIHPLAASLFSKHSAYSFTYPSPQYNERAFINRLLNICETYRPEVLMPMELTTLRVILKYRERFEKYTRIPFPHMDQVNRVNNKQCIYDAASHLSIPVPRAFTMHNTKYPAVAKPVDSSGCRGLSYCQNRSDLLRALQNINTSFGEAIIQEQIPFQGQAVCVSVLFDGKGILRAHFTHKRLREYPASGGPSTLRESIHLPEVEHHAIALMRHLHWKGIASVEFKHDPRDNVYKLLEVNGRFWGSLNLAIKSGVNFPYLLYQSTMNQSEPYPTYDAGVLSRWMFPGDILHFLTNPKAFFTKPMTFHSSAHHIHYDFCESNDIGAIVGMFASLIPMFMCRELRSYVLR